jgi:hypothetical protein
LRPGENPIWIDLPVLPAEGRRWRDRARDRGLGVDAWLGVLVEFSVAMRARGVDTPTVLASVEAASSQARLAPTDGLRRWERLLAGQWRGNAALDELPTVVLSERLVAQIPGHSFLDTVRTAVGASDEELAVGCDRVAATHGMTLDAWVLRVGLAAREG